MKISTKNALGIATGLIAICFIMYAMIVIEVRISDKTRINWLETYSMGFVTSQVVSPLIKALVDCILVIYIAKSNLDSKLENFIKLVVGEEIISWYAL